MNMNIGFWTKRVSLMYVRCHLFEPMLRMAEAGGPMKITSLANQTETQTNNVTLDLQ
jgi:hypothetical protein